MKKNIVFLPYKSAMWDSMESVWRAAKDDSEHCNAYVVPIPYADKNPDGSVREWHCEVNEYPEYVPVEDWQSFDLKGMHPNVIVTHNPYDDMNLVTSVESRVYSRNLKFYTDKLVYIPYYSTSGGMAEGQSWCAAYDHVDYIVTQAAKYRGFFDEKIPDEKFLPFGSPKFDKVIRLCNNPPAPPADWQDKMRGRKVYFYNTSIAGLLGDIRFFLQKMMYVFDIFRNRTDACLLWRPHPLLESTLKSMRPDYLPYYEQIRDKYISDNFGIYDTTPDIEKTIALCDAFIGDGATSVTSLFGVAGKPIFYLSNFWNEKPEKNDWLGQINRCWSFFPRKWLIVYGNQLWRTEDNLHYHFCQNLSEYIGGGYYGSMIEVDGKLFVCPNNAQDIVVIEDGKITERIPLERKIERSTVFAGAGYFYRFDDDYFLLFPMRYPDVVRYDFRHKKLDYIPCPNDIFIKHINEEFWRGSVFYYGDWIYFCSPTDNKAWVINYKTWATKTLTIGGEHFGGSQFVLCRQWGDDDYYFVPYNGRVITRINMKTGKTREYPLPDSFKCYHPTKKYACDIRPFANGIFKDEKTILLAPNWGNMFVKLHIDTGVVEEWKTPFAVTGEGKNRYYFAGNVGCFLAEPDMKTWGQPLSYHFWHAPERRRYEFAPVTEEFTPIDNDIIIDEAEFRSHLPGFCELNEHTVYGCTEDVFNSLEDFLSGNISGAPFDKEKQLAAYGRIAANLDGTVGEKVYRFVMERSGGAR